MIERILQLIKDRGITAYKMTTDIGISKSKVTEWKKGIHKPSTEAIIKIADYFGVTCDYLLTGKGSQMVAIITKLAKERGSGEDFSDKMKIGQELSITELICVADYFDVSLDYLVGRSDNPKRLE